MGAQTLTTALLRASALVLAFNLLAPTIRAEERRYAGLDTLSRIKFYDGITVDSSETVAIDGRMLKRWKDYRPDYILSTIQLYANDSGV
ncbi:MAG: hypothetical protein IIB00_10055, partial [candidate division Zixibacteria bacterium]|nr:hypothetical protein [candidate division Zixibacteria bacterium]